LLSGQKGRVESRRRSNRKKVRPTGGGNQERLRSRCKGKATIRAFIFSYSQKRRGGRQKTKFTLLIDSLSARLKRRCDGQKGGGRAVGRRSKWFQIICYPGQDSQFQLERFSHDSKMSKKKGIHKTKALGGTTFQGQDNGKIALKRSCMEAVEGGGRGGRIGRNSIVKLHELNTCNQSVPTGSQYHIEKEKIGGGGI